MRNLAAYLADERKRALDDRDLTSRSDLSKARKEAEADFAQLARALCDCTVKQFNRLQLPQALQNVVLEARKIESPSAKDRALRLVRRELRNSDAEAIRRQLDAMSGQARNASPPLSEQWRDRLISEREPALNDFVDQYPQADRKQLRVLVRNVLKADEANRKKAIVTLTQCVSASIRTLFDTDSV